MMTEFFVVSACLLTTLLFFRHIVPWFGQKIALYGLHELRDQFYELARSEPWIRETLFYRDVEFMLTLYIHVTREKPFERAAFMVSRASEQKDEPIGWRGPRVRYEMTSVFVDDRESFANKLRNTMHSAEKFVWLRVVLGHPAVLLMAIAMALATTLLKILPLRWLWVSGESRQPDIAPVQPKLEPVTRREAVRYVARTMPRHVFGVRTRPSSSPPFRDSSIAS